jgi:hypothetical protein
MRKPIGLRISILITAGLLFISAGRKKLFCCLLASTGFLFPTISAFTQPLDFYAYYTRLPFDDDNNTGKYADIVVPIGQRGRFVFSREYGYLPYWETAKARHVVGRLVPVNGDGPKERPDRVNKCSYARLIESSAERVIVHWRYAPDLNSPGFADFRKSYDGDIGKYLADVVDEYFIIRPDATVLRKAKRGSPSLKEWNDPLNVTSQDLILTAQGIAVKKTVPARLQDLPGSKVAGAALKKGGILSPVAWWKFDEGLEADSRLTIESVKGVRCSIGGAESYWRAGVSGTCLSYDGYTNRVSLPAADVPRLTSDFTIEAWIAPQEYSWNRSGIVDHDQGKRAGYSMVINHLGQIGLYAHIGGEWQGLTTGKSVELLKWTHVTGVFDHQKGFAVYFNGGLVDSLPASGRLADAVGLDLLIGLAHEKKYPWAFEREITKSFLSNMVFSGRIDEVRLFDRALKASEIAADHVAFKPDDPQPLRPWVLPAGPVNATRFGAAYTKLECSPEWDGLWRVGDQADIVVAFDDKPCRFVFWRGTNYLPSLVTEPGPKGIWVSDQGPESYTDQCYEHMSDKMCRYSHVRLIENTDARVVVHWRNASVGVGYDWLRTDENGWGLWTDEYWSIYPDGAAVRYQVSRRLADFPGTQTQQNELLSQPGTRPEDNVSNDAITLSNTDGETEVWNYSVGPVSRKGAPIAGSRNLVYLNLRSDYKHFNIGEIGSVWTPYVHDSLFQSMRLAPGYSRYNTWNHYPFGLLPSDGTVATGRDRTSSSCLGTLEGLQHLLGDGRSELYNIYGLTNLPAAELSVLNRSWNTPPPLADMKGGKSGGYDKRQRAYVFNKESGTLSFKLGGSKENPILNPCFVIKNWGSSSSRLRINGQRIGPGKNFRQGVIRDTDGTQTLVIWIDQKSFGTATYEITA